MLDIQLRPATIGLQGSLPSWAAQDLEAQPIGTAMPFTFSAETGFVYLYTDFITTTPFGFNEFDTQDMESLGIGPITSIPPTMFLTTTPPAVQLLGGTLIPVLNLGDDDIESYPIGAIDSIKNSFFTGDITLKIGILNPPI